MYNNYLVGLAKLYQQKSSELKTTQTKTSSHTSTNAFDEIKEETVTPLGTTVYESAFSNLLTPGRVTRANGGVFNTKYRMSAYPIPEGYTGPVYTANIIDSTTGQSSTYSYTAGTYPPFSFPAILPEQNVNRQEYSNAYRALINDPNNNVVLRDPATNIFWVTDNDGNVSFYDVDDNWNPVQIDYCE